MVLEGLVVGIGDVCSHPRRWVPLMLFVSCLHWLLSLPNVPNVASPGCDVVHSVDGYHLVFVCPVARLRTSFALGFCSLKGVGVSGCPGVNLHGGALQAGKGFELYGNDRSRLVIDSDHWNAVCGVIGVLPGVSTPAVQGT